MCRDSTCTVFPRKDAAATIYFSTTAVQCLLKGGAYSRAAFNSVRVCTHNFIPSTFTHQFPANAMTDREEFMFSSAIRGHMCTSLDLLGSPSYM